MREVRLSDIDHTSRLAGYLSCCVEKGLAPEVAEKTRLHLLDTLVAIITGVHLPAGRQALAYINQLGFSGRIGIPGTDVLVDPVNAAFAAAMAAHADETDDSHLSGRFHPGCAVVPAALAMAQHRGANGRALLAAVAAGYDIGARATKALGFTGPRTGTHSTHCLGANFGGAAAAGALAGLNARQCEHLLSYATQQASGIAYWQRDTDHIEKAFDFGGMGARNGVFGALFVASGATGVTGTLTGDTSYISAFAEHAAPDELTDGLGERFEIMAASIKKWCVGSPIQAALDSVTWLTETEGVTAADVVHIRAIMPDDRLVIVNNRDMPDVCLQHLIALALVDGGVTFASSHDHERMKDPAILAMREKIEAVPSPELSIAKPARQAIIEIDLTDGRTLSRHTREVLGTPDNPMSSAQVEAKARELLTPVMGPKATEALIVAVRTVEDLDDTSKLFPMLAAQGM